jgi:hypothetical protein
MEVATEAGVSPINVQLGGLYPAMAHQLGQTIYWHVMFGQPPSEGVPQLMAGEMNAYLLRVVLQTILNA